MASDAPHGDPAGGRHVPLIDVFGPAGYRYYLITEDRLREARRLLGEDDYRDWLITTLAPAELEALGIPVDEKNEDDEENEETRP